MSRASWTTPDGWWYTALLPTGRRLVAYFTDADLAPPPLHDRAALPQLLRQTRYVAARAEAHPAPTDATPRRAPTHSSHLDTTTGDGRRSPLAARTSLPFRSLPPTTVSSSGLTQPQRAASGAHPHDRFLGPRHEATVRTIAFVQYPGLTPLDIVGPLQVFSMLSHLVPGYDTVVVGERIEPAATDTPLSLVPSHTFETMPDPYALIVPGGAVPTLAAMADEKLLDRLRTAAVRSEIVGSVCTGSLLLAAARSARGGHAVWWPAGGHQTAWMVAVAGNVRARRFHARNGWTDKGVLDHLAPSDQGPMRVPAHQVSQRSVSGGPADR